MPKTQSELLAAAESLLPELKQRSQEIDDLRQLPDDLARRLSEFGFYHIIGPPQTGGHGQPTRVLCELVERLATANGSTAWCVFIGATSQLNAGSVAPSQRAAMSAPGTVISGVFAPSGTARFESRDGAAGYVVNGHWKWGSSSRNADWICGALREVDAAGDAVTTADAVTRVIFRPDDLEMPDNWHTSGLRGTGSGDYLAHDRWLPAERFGTGTRAGDLVDEPIYRFPLYATLSTPCGAIALGMARACVDEVIALAKEKTPQGSRRTLAQRPILHHDVASMDTKLRAARALLYESIDAVWHAIERREPTVEDRLSIRTANVHAMRTGVEVIDRMYSIVGGSSIWADSCLQRHFRDVHTASQHMMVADSVMELAGRVLLGLDDAAPGL
ncbi:MAG: acyl-CoA dehydrogenase family protein [Pseudomonadota bacterium]